MCFGSGLWKLDCCLSRLQTIKWIWDFCYPNFIPPESAIIALLLILLFFLSNSSVPQIFFPIFVFLSFSLGFGNIFAVHIANSEAIAPQTHIPLWKAFGRFVSFSVSIGVRCSLFYLFSALDVLPSLYMPPTHKNISTHLHIHTNKKTHSHQRTINATQARLLILIMFLILYLNYF